MNRIWDFIGRHKFSWWAIVVLAIAFGVLLRCFGLDKDLPNFGLAFYQSNDEGQYSMMALNFQNYGSCTTTGDFDLLVLPTFRANVLGHLGQIICFYLIGDNYYAFRLPYAIASILCIVLTILTIRKISFIYRYGRVGTILCYAIGILLIVDFSVVMSGRCVENSVYRALATIALVCIWFYNHKKPSVQYFCLGLFSVASIFLVYFSNVHLLLISTVLGLLKLIAAFYKKETDIGTYVKYWFLGALLGLLFSEAYYYLIWGSSCISNFFASIFGYSERLVVGGTGTQSAATIYVKGFMTFWSSNMFFYSFFVLGLTALSICLNTVIAFKKKDQNFALVVGLLIAFIVQSTFTNDWIERKAISVFPVVYLSVFIMLCELWKCLSDDVGVLTRKSVIPSCAATIAFIPIALYCAMRLRYKRDFFADFETGEISVWFVCAVVQSLVLIASLVVLGICFSKRERAGESFDKARINRFFGALSICFVVAIACNGFFSTKYVFAHDNYSDKQAMEEMGQIVGAKYVGGSYTYSYTLYSDIKPVWTSDECHGAIEDGYIHYFCDYAKGPAVVNMMVPDGNYTLVESFDRGLRAEGSDWPIGLFELLS